MKSTSCNLEGTNNNDENTQWFVEYTHYIMKVKAKNRNNAKYKAWLNYSEVYKIPFIQFVKGIVNVRKAA